MSTIETLFNTKQVKEFAKLFKELEQSYGQPRGLLADAAGWLPVRLYERYYDHSVPHSLFGLAGASLAEELFPDEERWRPYVQQCWLAAQERKRRPLDLDSARNGGGRQERWSKFRSACDSGNFQEAVSWARGFLSNGEDRDFFRCESLCHAAGDAVHGGHKFLYLALAWRLAERLEWQHTDRILAPVIHFLALTPRDDSLIRQVDTQPGDLEALAGGQGSLSEEEGTRLERAILFGTPGDVSSMLRACASAGAGLDSLWEALVLAAAQGVCNADAGRWLRPVRAFHTACIGATWGDLDPPRRARLLQLTAALINLAASRSREVEENRRLDEVLQSFCPADPFGLLASLVSHTDPHAVATAVLAILEMEEDRRQQLPRALLSQAVKNDGQICYGHDLLFVLEACDSHRRFASPGRDRLLVAAGYFLGRIQKQYELFGAYGF